MKQSGGEAVGGGGGNGGRPRSRRTYTVKLDDQTGRLLVGPTARLTADDVTAIRDHRDELIALVKMCDLEAI